MAQESRASALSATTLVALCLSALVSIGSLLLLVEARQHAGKLSRDVEQLKVMTQSEIGDRKLADAALSGEVKAVRVLAEKLTAADQALLASVESVADEQRSIRVDLAPIAIAAQTSVARADTIAASLPQLRAALDARYGETVAALQGVAHAATELASRSDSMATSIGTMETRMQFLDASVRQALGKVYVAETPAEVAPAVEAAVCRWLPSDAWTQAPGDSDALRATLYEIRARIPAGTGSEVTGPVRRLEWWADALEFSEIELDSPVRLPSLVARARELEASAPFLIPNWCLEVLQSKRRDVMFRATALACNVERASEADVDEARALLAVTQRLFSQDKKALDQLNEMAKRLDDQYPESKIQSALDRIRALRSQRELVSKVRDPELRIQLLYGLDAQASALLTEIASDSERREAEALIMTMRNETAKLSKAMQDAASLGYQAYALRQIQLADADIKAADGVMSDDKEKIADALRWRLGDIDEQVLEPALRSEFSRVWSAGWNLLDSDWRRYVLINLSERPKKRIGEVR